MATSSGKIATARAARVALTPRAPCGGTGWGCRAQSARLRGVTAGAYPQRFKLRTALGQWLVEYAGRGDNQRVL